MVEVLSAAEAAALKMIGQCQVKSTKRPDGRLAWLIVGDEQRIADVRSRYRLGELTGDLRLFNETTRMLLERARSRTYTTESEEGRDAQ